MFSIRPSVGEATLLARSHQLIRRSLSSLGTDRHHWLCTSYRVIPLFKVVYRDLLPENWLSRSFRAEAEMACSGYTILCPLSYAFVFPCVRSSALKQPAFAFSLPGCKITA